MQLMISEVNWLRKNVTKVRAERGVKHANPHFRHGQVYHNKVYALIESWPVSDAWLSNGYGRQLGNRLVLEELDGRKLQTGTRGSREDQRSQNRISTEIEEVVVDTDAIYFQNV